MKQIVFKIDGMMCGMCEAHVCDAIRKAVATQKATASYVNGTATVICDDNTDVEAIKSAIHEEGYNVLSVEETPYQKQGLLQKLFHKDK